MTPGRILLIGLGLLITVGALFLVVRSFRGMGPPASPQAAATPGGAQGEEKGKEKEKAAPRWQSFLRPDDRAPVPPRPLLHFPTPVASPFHRAPAASPTTPLAAPSLRLEGVSTGDRPAALISGRVVRVGGTIDGYRLGSIGKSRVSLSRPDGERLDLVLGASPPPAAPATPAARDFRALERARRPNDRITSPPTRPNPNPPPAGGDG
jgi:hypothetical protein